MINYYRAIMKSPDVHLTFRGIPSVTAHSTRCVDIVRLLPFAIVHGQYCHQFTPCDIVDFIVTRENDECPLKIRV
jgi:hypothetical protein